VVSILMGIAALELLRTSIGTLVLAWGYHKVPVLDLSPVTIGILCASVAVKCCLYAYSSALAKHSGTATALSGAHACLSGAGALPAYSCS
jgi:divalent metal cation (Fe/Co/Zn/Cd) transporter